MGVVVLPMTSAHRSISRRSNRWGSAPQNETMLGVLRRLLDWLISLFWKKEMELALVGLQNSGKSTFMNIISVRIRESCSNWGADCGIATPSSIASQPPNSLELTDRTIPEALFPLQIRQGERGKGLGLNILNKLMILSLNFNPYVYPRRIHRSLLLPSINMESSPTLLVWNTLFVRLIKGLCVVVFSFVQW